MLNMNSIRPRPAARPMPEPAQTAPTSTRPQAPAKPKQDRDRLEFSWLDRNGNDQITRREFGPGDRRKDTFQRYDTDKSGKLSQVEYLAGRLADKLAKKQPTEPTEPTQPTEAPAPAPTIAYTTKNPYNDVDQLAADLGTDAATLREMNGWGADQTNVPAGTALSLPDTAPVREMVTQYQGGLPPVMQGGTTAPVAPTEPAEPGAAVSGGDVPQIYQMSPAGAENGYHNGASNCGPTSMAMIARSFGLHPELSDAQLINFLGDGVGTDANGTPHIGIMNMAANLGLPATQAGLGGDAAWIAGQLEAGKKVIVNGNFGLGGHYVTVTGMDASGNFQVNDPYVGPRVITPGEMEGYQNANTDGNGTIIGSAFAIG